MFSQKGHLRCGSPWRRWDTGELRKWFSRTWWQSLSSWGIDKALQRTGVWPQRRMRYGTKEAPVFEPLDQGSANSFCREPNRKYSSHCKPKVVRIRLSSLLCSVWFLQLLKNVKSILNLKAVPNRPGPLEQKQGEEEGPLHAGEDSIYLVLFVSQETIGTLLKTVTARQRWVL